MDGPWINCLQLLLCMDSFMGLAGFGWVSFV